MSISWIIDNDYYKKCEQTAVVDLDDMNDWKNILHIDYDYHIDQKGLWRVDIPDEVINGLDNF